MKNIIIAGPSRAGKTALARKLNEELNVFVISIDKLVAVFQGAYPQLMHRPGKIYQKLPDLPVPELPGIMASTTTR